MFGFLKTLPETIDSCFLISILHHEFYMNQKIINMATESICPFINWTSIDYFWLLYYHRVTLRIIW